jgi:hypothetical protein
MEARVSEVTTVSAWFSKSLAQNQESAFDPPSSTFATETLHRRGISCPPQGVRVGLPTIGDFIRHGPESVASDRSFGMGIEMGRLESDFISD